MTTLLLGASIWGVAWYPFRLLQQAGISGELSTALAYFIALLTGLILFRKHIRLSKIRGPALPLLLGIALCAGCASVAYTLGIIHGEVMRVLFLFYLAPLWTILFARMLLAERLSRHGYAIILSSLAGALLLPLATGPEASGAGLLWRLDGTHRGIYVRVDQCAGPQGSATRYTIEITGRLVRHGPDRLLRGTDIGQYPQLPLAPAGYMAALAECRISGVLSRLAMAVRIDPHTGQSGNRNLVIRIGGRLDRRTLSRKRISGNQGLDRRPPGCIRQSVFRQGQS